MLLLFPDESQECAKILPPLKAVERSLEGSMVNEPERRRLLRSVRADAATEEATEAECRKLGRIGGTPDEGVCAGEAACWSCSVKDSVEGSVLPRLEA